MKLNIAIAKLQLRNPILVASGTFGYAQAFEPFVDFRKIGGIITKTITPKARSGNPAPRIAETASGMLNAIGLQNEGIAHFLKHKMPYLHKIPTAVVVSIGGESVTEFVSLAKRLDTTSGVDAIELNISCPNITGKKRLISQDAAATQQLVRRVRNATKKPLITKLSPNVTDIVEIAQAAEAAGSDAVSLVNTFMGMAVDIETRRPRLANVTGGLSGPAIKPIALRMVWEVARTVRIPVIGMGGIMNVTDVLEFLAAGARAVCLGTVNFVDPTCASTIAKGLAAYMNKKKIATVKKLINSLDIA